MCISFLPLPTEILATYLHKGSDARVAVTFYAIGLVLLSVSWTLMWLHANHGIGWSINGAIFYRGPVVTVQPTAGFVGLRRADLVVSAAPETPGLRKQQQDSSAGGGRRRVTQGRLHRREKAVASLVCKLHCKSAKAQPAAAPMLPAAQNLRQRGSAAQLLIQREKSRWRQKGPWN
jgi:hypothetical protein